MEFKTVAQNPAQPQGPAKYTPTPRSSPSLAPSTAPIPGANQPVQFRGLPPSPDTAGAPQEAAEGAPPEQATPTDSGEPLTAEELAGRQEWWSKRLSVLSRRDKEARRTMAEAKAEAAQVKAEKAAVAAEKAKIREWEAQETERRRNPRKALQDAGFNPEAALQFMLNGEKLTPEQAIAASLDERLARERQERDEALQAVRDEQAQRDAEQQAQSVQAQEAAQAEQEQMAVQEIHADISDIVNGAPETYRMLAGTRRAPEAVYNRLEEMSDKLFAETGRRPHLTTKMLEQAADYVEKAARAELEEYNKKMGIAPAALPRTPTPQTLTNRMRPSSGQPAAGQRQETEGERRKRVLAQLDAIRAADRARGGG